MIDSQHITANISLETFIRVTKKEDFAILKSASYIIEKSNLKISNSQVEKLRYRGGLTQRGGGVSGLKKMDLTMFMPACHQ